MTIRDDLLNDLRSSPTDLARIVEAVVRDRRPYVTIPVQTVRSWERRAPDDWAPRWTPENRPVVDGAKPASGRAPQARVFYSVSS